MEEKRGGIFNVTCEGDLPRDASQASRIEFKRVSRRASSSVTDPLQSLIVNLKEQSGQSCQFVQAIQLVPDPTIVLFNDRQINDIEQYCSQDGRTSVLGGNRCNFQFGSFLCHNVHISEFKSHH